MNKFKSIFEQIKQEHTNAPANSARTKNSNILVVDGTNSFIRCWTVVPTLNDNGEHVGGISGFLTSMGYAIKMLKPTRVIIVFDGKGGSLKRKKLYPEYKEKRAMSVRVNRAYEDMGTPDTEKKAMLQQMSLLIDFLRELPISLVCVDYIEADDAIAYISTQMHKDAKVTIMSSDKDFLQLVNERVSIWSPIKKKIYGVQDVINEYGIHPTNFIYYRILEGDTSDNIDGVNGIGLKTAIKSFPMLTEEKESSVEEILARSKDQYNEKKIFAKVLDSHEIIHRNYKLMQLKNPDFSPSLQMNVESSVERIFEYNKIQFIQKMTRNRMQASISNYHVWLQEVFWPLSISARS
jgi:5'-3' exonuclease